VADGLPRDGPPTTGPGQDLVRAAALRRKSSPSEGTVKGHVSRIMAILDCDNRTQLALRAVRQR
jgi:hypothetical protein